MKKTVLLGASNNPDRVAYLAAHRLKENGIDFVPVSIKSGEVAGKKMLNLRELPTIQDVDTVTLYIGPKNMDEWMDYVISLKPKRIIFNPGTENPKLVEKAEKAGIASDFACTLTLLATGQY